MPRRISLPSVRLLALILLLACRVVPAHAQDATVLPPGQAGKPYSISIGVETENGKGQFTWKLTQGDLPPGLQLSADGKLEGTPTGTKAEPYLFELTVFDSSQPPQSAVLRFSITIAAAPLRVKAVNVASTQLRVRTVSAAEAPPSEPAPSALKSAAPAPAASSAPPPAAPDPPATPKAAATQPVSSQPPPQPQPQPVPQQPQDQPPPVKCTDDPNDTNGGGLCGGPMLRTIVGFEQAGVSAAQSKQDFFFDLMYDRPLAGPRNRYLGAPLRSWGNLRISSVPQQIDSGVAQFATEFAQQVGNLKVNQVAQSFEFLGGIQYRLFPFKTAQGAQYAATPPDKVQRQVVSLNLIAGGGVITPLSPRDSIQIFDVPSNQPSFFTQYPQAMGKQFVAFTLQDRNRFFRQAYGGLRFMTHFLGDTSRLRFPETFDLTYGFNESVTGGRIRGGVLRLEGFAPIPYASASWIYFFGTGIFKPGAHAITANPFILDQAPAGTLPTNPNAVIIPTPQADRDYYRIGVGIDFIDLVNTIKNAKPKTPSPTTSATPPGAPPAATPNAAGNQPHP